MRISKIIGILTIPQRGCFFGTIAGEATTLAQVMIAPADGPDDGLPEHHRRFAEAHPVVSCTIRADLSDGARSPDAFDAATLRWAVRSADYIAIWSARFPQFNQEIKRDAFQAVSDGFRFLTTIETTPERAPEWAAYLRRWKRKDVRVRVYGPEIAGGVR